MYSEFLGESNSFGNKSSGMRTQITPVLTNIFGLGADFILLYVKVKAV